MEQRATDERTPASADTPPHGPVPDIVPVTNPPEVKGEWYGGAPYYWSHNVEASSTANATWTATLKVSKGTQLTVAAFLPPERNYGDDTASATYTIETDGKPRQVTKSQRVTRWLILGTFPFGSGSYKVTLTNATGEPDGTTAVVAAKMRWGYTGDNEPDDGEEP